MTTPNIRHREAAYGGEWRRLENAHLRLDVFRRAGGWGWGELYGPGQGDVRPYLGVLEHLAEVDFAAYAHPMRLESETVEESDVGDRRTLRFAVRMQTPEEPCMAFNNISPVEGTVELSLGADDAFVRYRLLLKGGFRADYRHLRGPWLRVGAYDDGARRDDAMFPGLEWLIRDEWSSGNDFHGPNNALRVTPHPHKVHIPMMTVSRNGAAATLSWPPRQNNVATLERFRDPQPVFASPNFVDRRPEHLLGLMLPTAAWGMRENALTADRPLTLPRKAPLTIEAEIGATPGRSLDAVVAWVRRNGLPAPPPPRWTDAEALDRIARALDGHFWTDGTGFTYGSDRPRAWMAAKPWGKDWRREPHMYLRVVDWYAAHGADRRLAASLAKKAAWCRRRGTFVERAAGGKIPGTCEMLRWYTDEQLAGLAERILAAQRPNGDFPYDPDVQLAHYAQHAKHAERWKPMGRPGDTVFDLCMTPSILLLLLGDALKRPEWFERALRTLDFALPIERPAGGDWWECPLQAPNLLSAAHGSMAYWLAWTVTGETAYRWRARHFLRALLPFTYLWSPEEKTLLYETKPLYGTTGWHYMAWTDRCVLWQVLLAADLCDQFGFDWAAFDPDLDWATYRRGIEVAGLRWLVDHADPEWMRRSEDRSEAVVSGRMDMVLADVHDPVDDLYGGIGIGLEPCPLAALLTRPKRPT
jgi:hypothetical protein